MKRILDIPREKDLLEALTEISMNMANLEGFVGVIKELFELEEYMNTSNTLRHVLGYFSQEAQNVMSARGDNTQA